MLQATALFTAFITGLGPAATTSVIVVKTVDLAGPKSRNNITRTVALTNNNGASDPYWIYLPHDSSTTSSNAADCSLYSRRYDTEFHQCEQYSCR